MRKVISNTTPIINFLKIGKIELLKEIYGKIIIPEAVYQEIETGKGKEFYTNLRKLDWIKIFSIQSISTRLYLFDLDDGEAETIILAQEQSADLVIIDEKLGRRYATQLNIPVTGTIGILLKAKEMNLITVIKPYLNELRNKSSWINDNLFEKVLNIAGEL